MKTNNNQKRVNGNFKGSNRGVTKVKYKKNTSGISQPVSTYSGNKFATPLQKHYSYQQDRYDNYGRPAATTEYAKSQSLAQNLMINGNKSHIRHIPTINYIKSTIANNIQDPTTGFLHIAERGLDGLSFDSMREEFDVLHPNELKTNIQPFIDAIYNSFISNGALDSKADVSIIKLMVREKNCIEKEFNYDKLALLMSKYAVEYSTETLVTVDAIKARLYNALAESVYSIETEVAKGKFDTRDVTRVNYVKVAIRLFLMEYASCVQEVLNIVKPKRYRI